VVAPVSHATAATSAAATAQVWVTYGDQSKLLSRLPDLTFSTKPASGSVITVDDSTRYQSVAGFGGALTESSASVISGLDATHRQQVLTKLFDQGTGIGISYLRQPLGASDFALAPAYDLTNLDRDRQQVIPLIRAARTIAPSLRLMLTPWSAPAAMKTSGSLIGGTLLDSARDAYAADVATAVAAYDAEAAPVDTVTIQNEPGYSPPDYPGMTLDTAHEAALATADRSALDARGLTGVKLVGHDHNWDTAQSAVDVLNAAPAALSGTAFHCYAGDVSAQSTLHAAAPGKDVYLSECTGGTWGSGFAGDLRWAMRNLFIGGLRNWARTVTLWNLVLDPSHGPHTGGCTGCDGLLTVDPATGSITPTVDYYALGQVAKFIRPGAVRVASTDTPGGLRSVAFVNPDGSHALVVLNDGAKSASFAVATAGRQVRSSLPAGGVATITW
jgi:glucosylceramidase